MQSLMNFLNRSPTYVAKNEPEYYKNTSKRLYKHIIPFKAEVDAFASKTEELASEYRNQK